MTGIRIFNIKFSRKKKIILNTANEYLVHILGANTDIQLYVLCWRILYQYTSSMF
jgi:hypothetical protein